MRKLIVAAVLPVLATIGMATPASASPLTVRMPTSASPLCFGVGQIGFCVPFTEGTSA